jgi:hypothetical protein
MSKGRTLPPRTPAQQREHDRRQALASLDIPALRAWMRDSGLEAELIADDDALVLRVAHEVRAVDHRLPAMLRRESVAWLREHAPESATLATIAAYPGEFRGPTYGKRRS